MDKPSFKLEVFEGPLDLLLHLISKNKVNIYDIPIADILKQYIDYMNAAEAINLELTGDFSAMAAQLIYIKSKMLLPSHDDEPDNDPRAELVDMLVEYQRMKNASVFFEKREELWQGTFTKQPEPLEPLRAYEYKHIPEELVFALSNMRERTEQRMPPPISAFGGIVGKERYSISDKTCEILSILSDKYSIKLSEILQKAKSRSELIACFLAVLELLKDMRVQFYQQEDGRDYLLTISGISVSVCPSLPAYSH